MRLTTKGKFAVTALLDITIYGNDGGKFQPISLYTISERQSISISYLEQLFLKLRRAGLVKSYKGPGGGYVLATPAKYIKISTIISSVDDEMDARTCSGMRNCQEKKQCLTHNLWNGLTKHVYNYLDKITLQDIVPNEEDLAKWIKYSPHPIRQNPTISKTHEVKTS